MKKLLTTGVLLFVFNLNLTPNNSLINILERELEYIKILEQERVINNKTNTILKTIRYIESRDRYDCIGGSGEYGAYQFTKPTWESCSKKYLGEILDIKDPKNQDIVAEFKIRDLLNRGYEIDEIASYWNSGKIEYKNNNGINSFGVYFDVPQYVNKFMKTYESIIDKDIKKNSIMFCNLSL